MESRQQAHNAELSARGALEILHRDLMGEGPPSGAMVVTLLGTIALRVHAIQQAHQNTQQEHQILRVSLNKTRESLREALLDLAALRKENQRLIEQNTELGVMARAAYPAAKAATEPEETSPIA